jgi:hypothetical protein
MRRLSSGLVWPWPLRWLARHLAFLSGLTVNARI